MKARIVIVLLALLPWLIPSCRQRPEVYEVRGTIHALMPDKKSVKIAHEEIPGYMPAMTMDFSVTNVAELEGLQPGDIVRFRMTVTRDDGWIDQVRKIGSTNPPARPAPDTMRRARYVEPLAVGDAVPEYTFTNQQGQVVRLSDFRGQACALNFIFTRCPFPTFCPRQSKGFSEVQQKLKNLPGGPTNWHLISITIDPAYDTPPRLKGYAKTYEADPAKWSFVTGDLEEITAIAEQVGLQFWRDNPEALPNHNVRTVVIDAAGRLHWVTVENEWKSDEVVEQLLKAAQARPDAAAPAQSGG